jgi:integrase
MKKKSFLIRPYSSKGHMKQDGSFPLVLSIRRNGKRKYIFLGASSTPEQWNFDDQIYSNDNRRKDLHPDRKNNNEWLADVKKRCREILKDFEENRIDWTLNQFEQQFLNKSKHTGAENYFLGHIDKLKRDGKIGNMKAYENTLYMLKLFDSKFGKKAFPDIDLKYIESFYEYLRNERDCSNNTIKYYMKTFRALINKAIRAKEGSEATYPFGKGGFSIAELEQETDKRYLPTEYIEKIKSTDFESFTLQWVRNLFLFSYYCQGISFVDMASLTTKNILIFEGGKYIAYRRHKTERGNSKIIRVKITKKIQELLDWFRDNLELIGEHLTPCVTIDGYEGEQLYNHIRDRYKKYNRHLKTLGKTLGFEGIRLSSYMSRHSYAMRLKNSGIPEDVISEALGHKNLSTTKVYLDSFQKDEIAKANEVL